MARKLTAQQLAFVQAYINGGLENAAAAYRVAYPTSLKWSTRDVGKAADRLLDHALIVPIVADAHAKAAFAIQRSAERMGITKEWLVGEVAKSFGQALEAKNFPGVGRLGELLSRLHGYIEDKSRVRVVRTVEDLSDEELSALAQTERESDTTRH